MRNKIVKRIVTGVGQTSVGVWEGGIFSTAQLRFTKSINDPSQTRVDKFSATNVKSDVHQRNLVDIFKVIKYRHRMKDTPSMCEYI